MYNENLLWDLLQSTKDQCPIFIEEMNLEYDKAPDIYSVISNSISNSSFIYGDNKSLYRRNTYVIRIHASDVEALKNIATQYQNILKENNIEWMRFGPTPDPSTGRFSAEISGTYVHGS